MGKALCSTTRQHQRQRLSAGYLGGEGLGPAWSKGGNSEKRKADTSHGGKVIAPLRRA